MITFAACMTTSPATSFEDSYHFRIECSNNPGIRQSVLGILRRSRARDIKQDDNGGYVVIEAAYYKSENPVNVLWKVEDDLRRIPQVLDVQVQENRSVIRQSR